MKYYEYTFFCEKIPNRLTMHSIVTHFFDKEKVSDINFKVSKNGRLVIIKTDKNKSEEFKINLFDKKKNKFSCELIKKEIKNIKKYEILERVRVCGLVEYRINITNKKGKKCPFFKGKFESRELQEKFKNNIERSLGVSVVSMSRENFSRLDSEIISDKIQANNIIEMDIEVEIKDQDLFNKIPFSSYFQRKSYGFGSLNIYE